MSRVIPPRVEPDDEFFWSGVADGRLLIQSCASCGTLRHPPGPMCGSCHSTEWDTQASSGRGVVHAWILSRPPGDPTAVPRIVVLVDLDEGIRFVSNLRDVEIAEIANGMEVELFFDAVDGVALPQFRPTEQAG